MEKFVEELAQMKSSSASFQEKVPESLSGHRHCPEEAEPVKLKKSIRCKIFSGGFVVRSQRVRC